MTTMPSTSASALKTNPTSPVIIIGMHRAGTSMLTRTLQGLGFFMGRGTSRNEECRYTNALNGWVFHQANATWERPEGIDALLDHNEIRSVVTDYLSGVTSGLASWRYLGLRRWLKSRSMHSQTEPWGWKDPRNTFTLPLWLEVFPSAKVLHITRHGVDVAASLQTRHRRAAQASIERYQKHRAFYLNRPWAPKRRGFAHNPAVADLGFGLALWRTYTQRAQAHIQALAPDRALELRYEDLLQDPASTLPQILDFCGLSQSSAHLEAEARQFEPERAYAYRHSTSLSTFARQNRDALQALGYDA